MASLIEELRATGHGYRQVWHGGRRDRLPVELAHADESVYYFDDPEHLTPRGHAAVAELLFAELSASLTAR